MFTNCPFCRRRYGTDPKLVGKVVRCSGCGNEFVFGAPPPASSGKRWLWAALVAVVVLAAVAFAAYRFRRVPRTAEKPVSSSPETAVARFEKAFLSRLCKETGNPRKNVKLRWETASVDPEDGIFRGICEFFAKKKTGGYAPSHFFKVCGRSVGGKCRFGFAEITDELAAYRDIDPRTFRDREKLVRDRFYAGKLAALRQLAEQTRRELDGIRVPDAGGGDADSEKLESELLERRRAVEIIAISVRHKCSELLSGSGASNERAYYSLLFADNADPEEELERAADGLAELPATRAAELTARIEQLRLRIAEAKRRAFEERMRARVLTRLTVAAMVDEAVAGHCLRHGGRAPDKTSVDRYEAAVKKHLSVLVVAFAGIRKTQSEIDRFGTPMSEKEHREMREKETRLHRHVDAFRNAFAELRKGISCRVPPGDAAPSEPCRSCETFRFPPEHVKIDFNLPEAAELDFSGYDEIPDKLLRDYLAKNPRTPELVRFGLPERIAALVKIAGPPPEDHASAGDAAGKTRKNEEEAPASVQDMLNANREKIKWNYHPGSAVACGHCGGRGTASGPPHVYRVDARVVRECPYCRGQKTVTVFPRCRRPEIPAAGLAAIRKNLSGGGGKFCDFSLGGNFESELSGKGFYTADKLLLVAPDPFGQVFYYRGNHRHPGVALTVLIRQFDLLTEVVLFTADVSPVAAAGGIPPKLPVFVRELRSVDQLPFGPNGKLMFDPGAPAARPGECAVSAIHAVHPLMLSANHPRLETPSAPCRWLNRPAGLAPATRSGQ